MAQRPLIQYASLSDVGRVRLANEDACAADPSLGLFVVCDGLGGHASGEAASQIIAFTFRHLLRRRLRKLDSLDDAGLRDVLIDITRTLGIQINAQARTIPALVNMGATLVAAVILERVLHLVHVGDSRAYLLRGGELRPLTRDHADLARVVSGTSGEERQQMMLTQFVGGGVPLSPDATVMTLYKGDRLLLCTDGLTNAVDEAAIIRGLDPGYAPSQSCEALVDLANQAGGPDNVTAMVIDYQGVGEQEAGSRAGTQTGPAPPRGLAGRFHSALAEVEKDLAWLAEGARESAGDTALSGFAAVKRRVGAEVYRRYLERRPTRNPAHIFHRVCTDPDSDWRRGYDTHRESLEKLLHEMTVGNVRLSPILTHEETATILRTLWQELRRVERRYFTICQRDAINEEEHSLDLLIAHMLASVRTLVGLMEFLPKFMRESA